MLLLRFWYVICMFVLILNLNLLWKLSKNEKFKVSDSKQIFLNKFAVCFKSDRIAEIGSNESFSIFVSQLINDTYDELENHFNKTADQFLKNLDRNSNITFKKTAEKLEEMFFNNEIEIGKSIKVIKNKLNNYFKDKYLFKKLLQKNESYSVNNFVCFRANETFLKYLEVFNEFNYKLFTYDVKPTFYSEYLLIDHKYKTHSGLRLLSNKVKKCSSSTFNSSFSPFECVNNCLIERKRKSNYMYKETEEKVLNFKKETKDVESEKYCNENCDRKYSFFGSYLSVNTLKGIEKVVLLSQVYYDSEIDFWIQSISLTFLFINVSFYSLMNKLINTFIKLLFERIKNQNLFRKLALKMKSFIFLTSLILTILISLNSAFDYIETLKNPIKTEITTFSFLPETLSLVICIPIQLNLGRNNNLTKGENIFEKYSFEEIEKHTDGDLDHILKSIVLKKISQINQFNLQERSSKVYFKRNNFSDLNLSAFSRCFRKEFKLIMTMYQDLITPSSLYLELDKICHYEYDLPFGYYDYNVTENFCSIYILDTFASFSSKSFKHENYFKINKKVIKKSTSFLQKNCTNYSSKLDCLDKQNCIEKCINKQFLKKYNSLSIQSNTVIDKDEISSYNLSKIFFNDTYDSAIINECSEKFMLDDCSNSYFFESFRKLDQFNLIEINLDFETIELKEIESSLSKLLLQILSIEILFFGNNVNALLFTVSALLKYLFKINQKWLKCFIFSFCLIGFCLHFLIVYYSFVNSHLVDTGLYKNNDKIIYPDMDFCFFYNNLSNFKIDKNVKLTGDYLNDLTSNFTIKSIFENISYINEQDQIIDINLHNFKSSHFKLDTYFFANSKCFSMLIYLSYERNEFYFRKDAFPLKIFLKTKSLKNLNNFYFTSKIGDFQKNYVNHLDLNRETILIEKYQVKTEMLKIEKYDQLKMLKNPFYLAEENDASNYLWNMRNEFNTKYDLFSSKFAIYEKYFAGHIDDDLFHQFVKQKHKLFDHNQMNFDSNRALFSNYVQTFYLNNKSEANRQADLEFSPIFFSKITLSTNEEGLARFVISILNVLSLWFGLCLLDLHGYFRCFKHFSKIFYPFILIYKKLIRLKGRLNIKCNNSLL